MEDRAFLKLLDHLRLSWSGYRKVRKGVQKRIARHMAQCGCRTVADYIRLLDQEEGLRNRCEQLMSVSVSRFFRDRVLWIFLGEHVLPDLLQRPIDRLRVWCAGCASGEEVYTLRMVWEEVKPRFDPAPDLRVLATDMNPDCLARGKRGVFPPSSLKEVPEAMRSRYFLQQSGRQSFAVRAFLKQGIDWELQHLISCLPKESFHLIFLRNNLLTYYREEVKAPVFEKVTNHLKPAGYLVIGSHEKPPPSVKGLKRVAAPHPIFYKENHGNVLGKG
jgi:chemotaxis methyl-accepting protein methylase